MRAKDFRLSPMSRRRFFAVLGSMAGICAAAGVGMRLSLTDVNAGSPGLEDLDYRISSGSEGIVGLYTRQEVLEELEKDGLSSDGAALAEAQSRYYMALDNVEDIAPVIVVAVFTGRRSYVFHALRERMTVTRVLKGEDVAVGEAVDVFEPYTIKEEGITSTGDNGQFSSERIITAGEGDYGAGLVPMREGQEYLLFLEPKRYPEAWESQVPAKTYCLAAHPYARVAVDAGRAAERIGVVGPEDAEAVQIGQVTVYNMPRIPFCEAVEQDIHVQTDRAKAVYLLTAQGIIDRVLA